MPRPTLTKLVAADGSLITVTTRIDTDGCLRIDVFAGKNKVDAAGTVVVSSAALPDNVRLERRGDGAILIRKSDGQHLEHFDSVDDAVAGASRWAGK